MKLFTFQAMKYTIEHIANRSAKYMSKICLHGQKLQQGSIGSVVNRGWGRRLGNKGIMVKLRIVVYY